jgi:type II secretory pathway pseudopilin PulG
MNAIFARLRGSIRNAPGRLRLESGVTLTEVMIATAIMSIAVLGMVGAFGGIQKAVQVSKNKTLASNLAQEQMQILTQQNYYQVLTTPSPVFLTNVTPNIPYDNTYFPPQTIMQGGILYTWYTYVQVAMENNGAIVVMPPSTPDTGLRLVTISVTWQEGGTTKQAVVNSILSNPNTVMTNSQFTGTVTDATSGAVIVGALVNIAENLGWRDTTKANGTYLIGATPGSYIMAVTAPGYFSNYQTVSIAQNSVVTTNFALTAMSSGTVTGTAWVNNSILISQVVVDTFTYCADGNQHTVEYIELFNPTTNSVYIGASNDGYYTNYNTLWYMSENSADGAYEYPFPGANSFDLQFVNNSVPAQSYFLIANATSFMINGVYVNADAYYNAPYSQHMSLDPNKAGSVVWGHYGGGYPSGSAVDSVAWDSATSGVGGAPHYYVPLTSTQTIPSYAGHAIGTPAGQQVVRYSSPSVNSSFTLYGDAYDSGYNPYDFIYPNGTFTGLPYSPHNVAMGAYPVISGRPASGAVISSNDPLSNATVASLVTPAGSKPYATFSLVGVATATAVAPWTVLITSGGLTLENDYVTVSSQGAVYTFPSSTTILNVPSSVGFIAGTVTDIIGNPITSPSAISVSGGGTSTTANSTSGRYLLRVSSGSIDVVANPGSANGTYVSVSSLAVTVSLGQVHDGINFVLSQGGQISGFVTRDGINALPGVAISAIDSNGFADDTEITNNLGYFTTIVMATGTYAVTPELDSLETSSPTYQTTNVSSGQTVFSTTFTISGAEGTISGSATSGGQKISTGVMIVVTTSTLAGSPPAPPTISFATLASGSVYLGSTLEDGTYSISVRQSTATLYNLYGYYTTVNSTGAAVIQYQELTNISVTAGQTVSGKNLAW